MRTEYGIRIFTLNKVNKRREMTIIPVSEENHSSKSHFYETLLEFKKRLPSYMRLESADRIVREWPE